MGGGEATGAEALVAAARRAGCAVVFANPGTTEMHLVGALDAGAPPPLPPSPSLPPPAPGPPCRPVPPPAPLPSSRRPLGTGRGG